VDRTDPAIAKLRRIRRLIRRLWLELERETPEGPQYEALAEQIRVLSAEYKALVNAAKKPEKL
jgi:hypothetical protein